MRTLDDVKFNLIRYQDLLREERKFGNHYIVVSNGMWLTKKNQMAHSHAYTLGTGDPVPMLKVTAEKNIQKLREKMMDDVKLECVFYIDWLEQKIKECKKLLKCAEKEQSNQTEIQTEKSEQSEIVQTESTRDAALNEPENQSKIQTEIQTENQTEKSEQSEQSEMSLNLEVSCPECPIGVDMCAICKFCNGIEIKGASWTVKCNYKTLK